MLLEQCEDAPYLLGLFLVHHQPSASRIYVVAQHWTPAHPFSLAPGCRHLIARTLADQFPFKLREAQEDIQRQPPQRSAGVELLRDRHETHFVLLENAQHAREVQQRPAQTVDFVYHHAVQCARLDRLEQPRQSWSIHVRAGETAIIIEFRQRDPAFPLLTLDESLAASALRIERVKFLIESFLGGFPGIDRASQASRGRLVNLTILITSAPGPAPYAFGQRDGSAQRMPGRSSACP